MALKKVFTVMLAILVALSSLVSFVGCSNEISTEMGETSVSFATSVSKAINQSGSVSETNAQVGNYYWKYYSGQDEPVSGSYDSLNWKNFSTPAALGLGTIPSLDRGDSYYFGLRGYSDQACTNLVWEGFHYNSAGTAIEKVKLTSKNQLITIDVYSAGLGYLYFDVTAPSVYGFDASLNAFKLGNTASGAVQYDYITWSIKNLDGTDVEAETGCTTGSDLKIDSTDDKYYSTATNAIFWSNAGNTSEAFRVKTGTYLMTVQQYGWDSDSQTYKAVNQRKQVLIVNIVAGVNTLVGGSLDSTELCAINYEANAADADKGLLVNFHNANVSPVTPLSVTVTTPSGASAIVQDNDRIEVMDGQYVQISWTTGTDYVKLYVNGDLLDRNTTDTDGYFVRASEVNQSKQHTSYVKAFDETNKNSVKAYSQYEMDYMITIEWLESDSATEGKSMSFTIVTKEATVATATGSITNPESNGTTTVSVTSSDSNASASVPETAAYKALDYVIDDQYQTNAYDNELVLTLEVDETETTATSNGYEISMKAKVVTKKKGTSTVVATTSTDIHDFKEFVTAQVKIEAGLSGVKVTHNGTAMQSVNSTDALASAVTNTSDDMDGFFYYDSSSGILYIKSKTFSPFVITFSGCAARIGGTSYSKLANAIAAAEDGDTVVLMADVEENVVIASGKNITLDLNGKTVNGKTVANSPAILNNGTVTITGGGTVKREDTGASAYYTIQNCGTMILDDVTVTNGSGYNGSGSSLIINDCKAVNGKLTINNLKFEQQNFIVIKNDNGELVINDGTFKSRGIYTNGDTVGLTSAVQNWDTCTINGGTFEGGLSVMTFGADSKMTINDGTFTNCTIWLRNYNNDSYNPELVINGGNFTFNKDYKFIFGSSKSTTKGTTETVTIKDGTFSSDPSTYVADGYTAIINGNETWSVVEGDYVCQIGDNLYSSLNAAFEAVTAGETIEVLKNCATGSKYTMDEPLALEVENVILDLNGKTITTTNNFTFVIAADNVTVKNGYIKSGERKNDGDTTFSTDGSIYRGYPLVIGGIADGSGVEGVKINNVEVFGGISAGGSVTSNATKIKGSAVVTLTDCTVHDGSAYALYAQLGSTMNVVSGTYSKGISGLACQDTEEQPTNNVISITGGTFYANPSGFVASGYAATENNGVWTVAAKSAN